MATIADWSALPPELLSDVRGNLGFVDRVSFALVCRAWRRISKPEAPWLVLPGNGDGDTPETSKLFSLTAGRVIDTMRAQDRTMNNDTFLGSSGGWLVTADVRAQMRLVNPVTGVQHDLPAITTSNIPFNHRRSNDGSFDLQTKPFLQIRFAGNPPDKGAWASRYLFGACTMGRWFYRKVVLSDAPRPGRYAAMLLLHPWFGAPAFATAGDAVWRLAASPDGVEDAIHHKGKFYSVTYTGVVEAWERDADSGEFTSKIVASSRLADHRNHSRSCRKYLAAAPDGRLMVVLKDEVEVKFKVLVVDEATMDWEETVDIGEAALFVGVNSSLCVSTREHPELKAGCVYFTAESLVRTCAVGVSCLRDGTVEQIESLRHHAIRPVAAWFTPCCHART